MLALAATLSLSLLVSGSFSSSRDLRALVDLLEETHGNGRNVHNERQARNNGGFTVRAPYTQEAVGQCPDGLWIESEYQCEAAATALELLETDAGERDYPRSPYGCYYKLSTGQLIWNPTGNQVDQDTDRVSLCHTLPTLPECTVGVVACRPECYLHYTCQVTDLPSVGRLLDGPTSQPWCPTGFVHWDRDLSNESEVKFDNVDSIEDCAEYCRLRSVFGDRQFIRSGASIFGPIGGRLPTGSHVAYLNDPCVSFEYERVGASKRCKLKTGYSNDTETIQNVNWRSCILLQAGQANSNLIVLGDSLVVQAPLSSSSSSGCSGPGSDNAGC